MRIDISSTWPYMISGFNVKPQMTELAQNSGVSCPLAFVANVWLNILEPESKLRVIFCGVLIHVRYTTAYVYSINLLFSFIFRTFLVLYSDRGLVMNIVILLKIGNMLKAT